MISKDYISMLIQANPIIYIDTASLMETEELSQFIENGEDIFLNKNRRIIVPPAVCLELVRHLASGKQEKQDKAMRVLELLNAHQDIFDVRNSELNEDDIYKAFADAEILAELTRKKKDSGQLLITNDRALSHDAFGLNKLGSCRGHRIMVCYINRQGELRRCDCTMIDSDDILNVDTATLADTQQESPDSVNVKKEIEYLSETQGMLVTDVDSKPSTKNIIIPLGAFFLGTLSCKYGKTAIRTIASLVK